MEQVLLSQVNHDWIQSWMGRHWYVGLKFGNDDGEKIRAHVSKLGCNRWWV